MMKLASNLHVKKKQKQQQQKKNSRHPRSKSVNCWNIVFADLKKQYTCMKGNMVPEKELSIKTMKYLL